MVGIEARLASVLVDGEPSITVIGAMRHEQAYANDLWFLDSDAGPLVAKLRRIPEEDPEQLRAYARSMARLRDVGFPTPELLLLDDECDALDGRQFSVLRYAEGTVATEAVGDRNRPDLLPSGTDPASSGQVGSMSTMPRRATSWCRATRSRP